MGRREARRAALGCALALGALLLAACAPAGGAPATTGGAPAPAGAGQTAAAAPAPAAAPPATGSGAATGAPAPPPSLVPLNVSYSGLTGSQSPPWIGVEAGIFAQHGLDVSLHYITSSPQSTAALMSGEVDVSVIGGQGIIAAALGGADTVFIAAIKNQLNGHVVGSSTARSMAELRGKKIAISRRGSNPDYLVRLVLPRFGLDPDQDVIGIQTSGVVNSVQALKTGAVDAASLSPPSDKATIDEGYPSLFDATSAGVKWPATQVATTRSRIAQKPDALQRLAAAMAEAVQRYKADKPFALSVLARYTRADSEEAVEAGYLEEAASMLDDLRPDLAAIQAALEQLRTEYPAAANARAEEFVDFRFVDRLGPGGAAR